MQLALLVLLVKRKYAGIDSFRFWGTRLISAGIPDLYGSGSVATIGSKRSKSTKVASKGPKGSAL